MAGFKSVKGLAILAPVLVMSACSSKVSPVDKRASTFSIHGKANADGLTVPTLRLFSPIEQLGSLESFKSVLGEEWIVNEAAPADERRDVPGYTAYLKCEGLDAASGRVLTSESHALFDLNEKSIQFPLDQAQVPGSKCVVVVFANAPHIEDHGSQRIYTYHFLSSANWLLSGSGVVGDDHVLMVEMLINYYMREVERASLQTELVTREAAEGELEGHNLLINDFLGTKETVGCATAMPASPMPVLPSGLALARPMEMEKPKQEPASASCSSANANPYTAYNPLFDIMSGSLSLAKVQK